jgi:hypothetical protein
LSALWKAPIAPSSARQIAAKTGRRFRLRNLPESSHPSKMSESAVCIRCGSFKQTFMARCPSCGFLPELDIDVAKSRMLGEPYNFAVGKSGDVVETGRTLSQLQTLSAQIRSGSPYTFPEEELAGVLQVSEEFKTLASRRLIRDVVMWLAPPVALGLIFAAAFFWK